jgi:hypothetical protein
MSGDTPVWASYIDLIYGPEVENDGYAFAAILYYLASRSDYKVVCGSFSMSKQALQKWVPIVINALDERLIPQLIVFLSGRKLHQVMRDFECTLLSLIIINTAYLVCAAPQSRV